MSRGFQQHQQRALGLSSFGKELTRRSGSCCELCESCGVKLVIYEVPPVPAEPSPDHCLFICEACEAQIERPKLRDPDHWRCLTRAVWSPLPVAQVMALWMARQLADQPWVAELLEQVYLPPEVESWLNSIDN